MEASCAQILGLILLVNTNLAIIIAFATPYWVEQAFGQVNRGIWATCRFDNCQWSFDNDFELQKMNPVKKSCKDALEIYAENVDRVTLTGGCLWLRIDWFKAVQGLMSAGLALGLVALLVTTLSLCCTCHSCNPHQTISGLMLTSSVAMAVGIVVFGVKAHDDWKIEIEKNIIGFFGWSFWVGVGATALALLTSFVYCCMGRNNRQ